MFGVKVFPFPIFKTYWPYAIGFATSYYLVTKGGAALQDTDEFINDPRHPRFKNGGKFIDLSKREE